jgi:tryptophan synthase beta chain
MKSYLLQDSQGQVQPAHSISAGLDYPGIGPEHAQLHKTGRATYLSATDADALRATAELSQLEGILPALESAHALSVIGEVVSRVGEGSEILVNLSGRGDKDMETLVSHLVDGEA